MSTNSIFRAISCQHFRLLTIVWHLDDNQGPQFDKRLQQMFNFAEGRWLLWYLLSIYLLRGFWQNYLTCVLSHELDGMTGFSLRSGNTRHNFVSQIFFCTSSSQIYLEWFCEMHAMSPLCQKRNVSLRNVSLSKEKWRTSIHAMVCSIKQPLHARKIKIYEFVNSMKIWGARPLLLHSTLLPSPIFHIISDACQGQKCIHALHLSIKHPHHSQPWMWKMWFVLLTNQMWWSKRSPVKLEHGPIKNRCSVLHIQTWDSQHCIDIDIDDKNAKRIEWW